MRYALILALLPLPASAWEFSPEPLCTLSHSTKDADIILTYDAAKPLYTLGITLKNGTWQNSPSFGMSFFGGQEITIGTGQHRIDGSTLSVADSGFGNVLNGLEFNTLATAFTDSLALNIPLSDAASSVKAFRKCPAEAPATS